MTENDFGDAVPQAGAGGPYWRKNPAADASPPGVPAVSFTAVAGPPGDPEEARKLREAIAAAGYAVMQTSGAWSIHDVSDRGKQLEEDDGRRIIRNIELEAEVARLRAILSRIATEVTPGSWVAPSSAHIRNLVTEALGDPVTRDLTTTASERLRADLDERHSTASNFTVVSSSDLRSVLAEVSRYRAALVRLRLSDLVATDSFWFGEIGAALETV